jgi:RNA polymerase sigma factor (sigma-70 family)
MNEHRCRHDLIRPQTRTRPFSTRRALVTRPRGTNSSADTTAPCVPQSARTDSNPADTADAIQNTWLRLFERAATIRNPDMLGGWVTARRECLALIHRQRAELPLATIDSGLPAPDPTPEAAVITAEAQRHVRLATDRLSDRQRTLIDALYYHPVGSYADVRRHTGMPIGSIGPTHQRAIRCLRHRLSDPRPEG